MTLAMMGVCVLLPGWATLRNQKLVILAADNLQRRPVAARGGAGVVGWLRVQRKVAGAEQGWIPWSGCWAWA